MSIASGTGSQRIPFSDHCSRSIASPCAGLVNVAASVFAPLFKRTALLDADAALPPPDTSSTGAPFTSSFNAPLSSARNMKSPRKSATMLPRHVVVNFPAGRNGVGDWPATT